MKNRKTTGLKTARTTSPKVLLRVIWGLMILLVVVILLFMLLSSKQKKDDGAEKASLEAMVNNATRAVYKAAAPISNGQMITEDVVTPTVGLYEEDPSFLFTAEDLGKMACVDAQAGQVLTKNMVSVELSGDYQERECNFVWLSTNLKEHDYVNVRILFPNGEDYVVAAKKSIKQPNLEINNVFLWLTEDEILNLDAAVVDANLNGAKIYTTKYVRPTLQNASEVTYKPNLDVQNVIASNPNIVDESKKVVAAAARRAMEERIAQFREGNPNFTLEDTTDAWQAQQEALDEEIPDETEGTPLDGTTNDNLSTGQLDTTGTADSTQPVEPTKGTGGKVEYVE